MKRFSLKFFLLATSFVVVSCGTPSTRKTVKQTIDTPNGKLTFLSTQTSSGLKPEKVIGDNDLTPVVQSGSELPVHLKPLVNAFGLIDMGCTATHLGKGIVLTAGHCFDAGPEEVTDADCTAEIKWGFRVDAEPYLVSKCTKILAMRQSENFDYAIIQVDKVPDATVEISSLSSRPSEGTKITLFGHPRSRPLEWSRFCTMESAEKGGFGSAQFAHQCDSEPGNSGSTVLDESGKIVGIHDGGFVPWNYATFLADIPLKTYLK